ncbi:MAG: carboxypeptidase-like regulatory domain-containing protein [Bacteroides sp.]|nr:carboxypeptidase-like regulatory domain-containing protein [Bacteroides sp.]
MGKAVVLAGLSAGAIAMLAPIAVQSQTPDTSLTKGYIATQTMADTIIVKGVVLDGDTLKDGTISREPLVGAAIINPRMGKGTATDVDGNFQIGACKGDSLEISYVGFKKQSVIVLDDAPLEIMLHSDDSLILGELAAVTVGAISAPINRNNMVDLHIIDENKKTLPYEDVTIERVYLDEDGEEDADYLDPVWIEEKGIFRIYWNEDSDFQDDDGKPLKEAILRIEVDGYDNPQTIKVKYPKRNTKKTIKFKHEKKK